MYVKKKSPKLPQNIEKRAVCLFLLSFALPACSHAAMGVVLPEEIWRQVFGLVLDSETLCRSAPSLLPHPSNGIYAPWFKLICISVFFWVAIRLRFFLLPVLTALMCRFSLTSRKNLNHTFKYAHWAELAPRCGGLSLLPKLLRAGCLEALELIQLPELNDWHLSSLVALTALRKLFITDCPSVRVPPSIELHFLTEILSSYGRLQPQESRLCNT
jgi:hypothetical protein